MRTFLIGMKIFNFLVLERTSGCGHSEQRSSLHFPVFPFLQFWRFRRQMLGSFPGHFCVPLVIQGLRQTPLVILWFRWSQRQKKPKNNNDMVYLEKEKIETGSFTLSRRLDTENCLRTGLSGMGGGRVPTVSHALQRPPHGPPTDLLLSVNFGTASHGLPRPLGCRPSKKPLLPPGKLRFYTLTHPQNGPRRFSNKVVSILVLQNFGCAHAPQHY